MARKDGTGPNGDGPKTGRGLGNCPDDGSKKDRFGNGWKIAPTPGRGGRNGNGRR